ncbi:MAG: hypothetical protein IPK50_19625 [Fibrobacterota bacterium]|nr:hypothetical protein [Fibrobacterota bacterium]QQS04475.1 MAG: hypothetical protein IPK50_19625 [Fibrobacterota bacterium]
MKILFVLLAIPGFVVAGQISGKVIDLSDNPLAGVVVESKQKSDITKPSGSWILGGQAHREPTAAISRRVSSNLVVQNGRMRVSWSGRGADGRLPQTVRQDLAQISAPRSLRAAQAETLWVYWKGKRLAQRPVESEDTTGISIRIDTSWNDDAGIPWNPDVQYGTLQDSRDGNVYRTVQIGDQTWMAEGLRFVMKPDDDSSSSWFRLQEEFPNFRTNPRWGVLYVHTGTGSRLDRAICPEGWKVPTKADAYNLAMAINKLNPPLPDPPSYDSAFLPSMGRALRSITDWPDEYVEQDPFGFRLLPSGNLFTSAYDEEGNELIGLRYFMLQGTSGAFWVSDYWVAMTAGGYQFRTGGKIPSNGLSPDGPGFFRTRFNDAAAAIRCVKI